MLQIANQALKDKKYEKAVQLFSDLTASEPESALGHAGLAEALFKMERFSEAQISAEQAIKLDDTLAEAYSTLALIHMFQNDEPQIGYSLAEKAYELEPDSAKVIKRYGALSIYAGRVEQGLKLMEQALRIQPDDEPFYPILIAEYMRSKKYNQGYQLSLIYFKRYPSFKSANLVMSCFPHAHIVLTIITRTLFILSLFVGMFFPYAFIYSIIIMLLLIRDTIQSFLARKDFWMGFRLTFLIIFFIGLVWLALTIK